MPVQAAEKYCPICGKPVTDATYNRFGEFACSEAHVEDYVKEVRAQKVQAHAGSAAPQQERPRQMRGG